MPLLRADSQSQQCYGAGLVVSMWFSNPGDSAGESMQLMPVCNSKVRSRCLRETLPEAERSTEHSRQDITKDSPETSSCSQALCQTGCHLSQALSSTSSCLWNSQHMPPRSKQVPTLPAGPDIPLIPLFYPFTASLLLPACWKCRGTHRAPGR